MCCVYFLRHCVIDHGDRVADLGVLDAVDASRHGYARLRGVVDLQDIRVSGKIDNESLGLVGVFDPALR